MIFAMHWRRSFMNYCLISGAIGVAVPLVLILRWWIFQQPSGVFDDWLWPSSIMFMALQERTARSTVVFIYALAIAENALLYAIIGAIMWFAVSVFNQLRTLRR
jgi:hypothetical protein